MKLVAQILGLMAVALFVLSYQQKKRKNIILLNIASRVFYVVQYILLGAFEGTILDFLAMISSYFAQRRDKEGFKKYNLIIFLSMNFLFVIVGILLYRNIFSIIAVLAAMLETGALWIRKEKNIRMLTLVSAPLWFLYNMANLAIGSAVGNILTVISVIIGMYRHDMKSNNTEEI